MSPLQPTESQLINRPLNRGNSNFVSAHDKPAFQCSRRSAARFQAWACSLLRVGRALIVLLAFFSARRSS